MSIIVKIAVWTLTVFFVAIAGVLGWSALMVKPAPAAAPVAQKMTPADGKRLAERAMQVFAQIEPYAVIAGPERIDSGTYMRQFHAPLNKLLADWPGPWYDPQYDNIKQYHVCQEAGLALMLLQSHRLSYAQKPHEQLFYREAEKARADYFMDKKPRCAEVIKTGAPTERRGVQ